jgi:hypothetical protein
MDREYEEPDYHAIDPILKDWAREHDRRFDEDYRGDVVRSIWMHPIQLWVDAPDKEGFVRVHAAERRPDLSSQWGRKLEWRTTKAELRECLDQVWTIATGWT